MKKEKFLELFPKDAVNEARKLYNYFETAEKYEINIFTEEFYTPNFWKKLGAKIEGISIKTCGLTEISERRQILFENYEDDWYVIKENYISITPVELNLSAQKFGSYLKKELDHEMD